MAARRSSIEFSWGSVTLPKAAPVSITIRYVLFRPNGEPVRAFVDLELAQAEDTNPPGQGTESDHASDQPDFERTRVRDGDSLPSIAYGAYGDATKWRDDRRGQRDRQPAASATRQRADDPEAGRMSATAAERQVSLYTILVDGSEIDARSQQTYPRGPHSELPAPARHVHARRVVSQGARPDRASRSTKARLTSAAVSRSGWRARRADDLDGVQGRDRDARTSMARGRCGAGGARIRPLARADAVAQGTHLPEPDVERHRLQAADGGRLSGPMRSERRAARVRTAEQRDRLGADLAACRPKRARARHRWADWHRFANRPPRTRSSSSGRRRFGHSILASPRFSRSTR